MAPCQKKIPPSAPHEVLRSAPTHRMDGQQPSKLVDVFWGEIEGVYGPQSTPLFRQWCITATLECFEGHTHPQQPPKLYPCSGGCQLSIWRIGLERKASCGTLGGHFRRRRPWSAMVVLINVGRWRLTSDQPTGGIVTIVYGSNFLFLCRSHTFLTSDPAAKKGRFRPSHFGV